MVVGAHCYGWVLQVNWSCREELVRIPSRRRTERSYVSAAWLEYRELMLSVSDPEAQINGSCVSEPGTRGACSPVKELTQPNFGICGIEFCLAYASKGCPACID